MGTALKFCMITTFYPPYNFGGDGIYIYRLSNELAERGHSVDVIHCEDAFRLLQTEDLHGEFPNHPNVTIHRLKSRAGFLSPLFTQQTSVPFFKRTKIKRLLEATKYDVIHYHNISLIGVTALRYGSAIKLYTIHEYWLVCPMHVLWKFDREACTEKSCLRCQVTGKRPPQLWRYTGLLQRMLRNVDAFISPSQFTLKKHLKELNIPIRHIPHFLPRTELPEIGIARWRPYFLFVGRLERIKGAQNLIPVFRQLAQYDLLLAGEGAYANELKKLAGESHHIRFLGRLSMGELLTFYRQAIAVIAPSICYEVFGNIILEAFAMKTPVIVSNFGALPEVVRDSTGGFIYNNEAELIAAIQALAKDPRLRNEMGEKGYQSYLQNWTADRHMEQYLGLIEELRQKRSASK